MNLKLDPKSAVLGAVLVLSGALAADQLPGLIPYVFKAGDPVRSAEVNANFASLGTAVEGLQGAASKPITTERLAEGSVTARQLKSLTVPANGQVLAYINGQLHWQNESPTINIYQKITHRSVQVPGNLVIPIEAKCDGLDAAIGGVVRYVGGESRQYLQIVSSYPNHFKQFDKAYNSQYWITELSNNYGGGGNAKSIIYVDIGVMCLPR